MSRARALHSALGINFKRQSCDPQSVFREFGRIGDARAQFASAALALECFSLKVFQQKLGEKSVLFI